MKLAVVLLLALALSGCEKPQPIQIPATAPLYVTVSRVELLRLSPLVPSLDSLDASAPGWMFCEGAVCAAGTVDAEIVWGGGDAARARAEARWRGPQTQTLSRNHQPGPMIRGHFDLQGFLQGLKFEKPRSRELLERAAGQIGRLEFEADLEERDLSATVRPQLRAGEPRFVGTLGVPEGDLPDVSGLSDGAVAIARLSAATPDLWVLFRSLLPAEQRLELDGFQSALRQELAIDLDDALVENLTGHYVAFAYDARPPEKQDDLLYWLTGAGTEDAIFVGLKDAEKMQTLLNVWTQVSKGKLNTQKVDGSRNHWAWMEDGELSWAMVLGADNVVVVDGPQSYTHAVVDTSDSIPSSLVERGVKELLATGGRSGFYLDRSVLTAMAGSDSFLSRYAWVTAYAERVDDAEVVTIRIGDFAP